MAFVFRAERKIDFSSEETAKNPNLAPGAYMGLVDNKSKQAA
jgi:hypothetical protein